MSANATKQPRRTPVSSKVRTIGRTASVALEYPSTIRQPSLATLIECGLARLAGAWKWVQERSKTQRRPRKLRVCESVQLGEKRFVALIQADGQRFLVGGTSSSISLLATLPSRKSFRNLLPKDLPLEAIEK
jgi:hypothetical protein